MGIGQIMGINEYLVKGRAEEAQGNLKEVVGHAVGNKDREPKAKMQKDIGAVEGKRGDGGWLTVDGQIYRLEKFVGKYVLGWMLGIPAVVLVVVYLLFNH